MVDARVCGEADSVQDALHAVSILKPDLVIVDISLSGRRGRARAGTPAVHARRTPAGGGVFDERGIVLAELAFIAGARGYVMKHESPGRLVGAIRKALNVTGESPGW